MLLLRIIRKPCEDNGFSLGLQYIPSVLNRWADRLSHRRDAPDLAPAPAAVADVRTHIQIPSRHNSELQ
jgi:hypothetical protein